MEGADALSLISYRKQSLPQLFRGIQIVFEPMFSPGASRGSDSFTFHSLEKFVKQKEFRGKLYRLCDGRLREKQNLWYCIKSQGLSCMIKFGSSGK